MNRIIEVNLYYLLPDDFLIYLCYMLYERAFGKQAEEALICMCEDEETLMIIESEAL